MTKQNLETEYCNERGDSSFNNYNNNDYTKWLETKLIETEKQLILSGVSDIVHRAELKVLENVSDYIPCEIYSQAIIFSQKKRDNVR